MFKKLKHRLFVGSKQEQESMEWFKKPCIFCGKVIRNGYSWEYNNGKKYHTDCLIEEVLKLKEEVLKLKNNGCE